MRIFVITKDGIARIMRTYKLGPGGIVLPDDPDAPDAQDVIAKWHPDDQAQVSAVREIVEDDIPAFSIFKDAWRDTGAEIEIDMPTARLAHAERIAHAQTTEIARLKVAERASRLTGNTTQAEAQAATVVALEALDLNVLATRIAKAPNPTALKAIQ